ncbi:SH3 domain-containing protein [Paracoccus luteus]|uniref:SH3 domain-containing protein n=1 Tax=Paracoccus luteus TaxID=2508543 RepID=UPI001FEAA280|nr:SH3 domain-containing protein [Paracoccus luteus]
MFRVIALSLVALFGLLALLGTEWTGSPAPTLSAGVLPGIGLPAATPAPAPAAGLPTLYVAGPRSGIFARPARDAALVRDVPQGEPLYPLGDTRDGFVEVRDAQGRVGYVPAVHLSERPV